MERDDVPEEVAKDMVQECRDLMEECNYDPFECEQILADVLGLEPDYIFEILGY